jgi:hypothetical protein
MGPTMLTYRARISAILVVSVAILAPASEAQARHWGYWGSFGFWGQRQYEGRHFRSSANEGETDDPNARGHSPSRYRGFNDRASPLGAAVAELIKACVEGSEELQHWPNDSTAKIIAPDEGQRGPLEQLRGNAGQQAEILRTACPNDIPADPLARIDVSNSAVDAMLAAVNAVLPSIEGFYATLEDEQKARLNYAARSCWRRPLGTPNNAGQSRAQHLSRHQGDATRGKLVQYVAVDLLQSELRNDPLKHAGVDYIELDEGNCTRADSSMPG